LPIETAKREGAAATVPAETFRAVFSRHAAGVAIIGFDRGGKSHGFTATSLTPVSAEPPLLLFCVGKTNESHEHLKAGTQIGISILSEDQAELSASFAAKRVAGRFGGVATIESQSGVPLLAGAIAFIEGAVTTLIPAGDHTLYLCEVRRARAEAHGAPLLYCARRYRRLAPLSGQSPAEPPLQAPGKARVPERVHWFTRFRVRS
jgi:flavin reductase (DIM6/NTAB) family NADH-FMN oxidoreductase RutF